MQQQYTQGWISGDVRPRRQHDCSAAWHAYLDVVELLLFTLCCELVIILQHLLAGTLKLQWGTCLAVVQWIMR